MKSNLKTIIASLLFAILLTGLLNAATAQIIKIAAEKVIVFEKWDYSKLSKEDPNYIVDSLKYSDSMFNVFERKQDNAITINEGTGDIFLAGTYYRHYVIIGDPVHLNGYSLYRVNGGTIEIHHHKVFVTTNILDVVYFCKK